jgi:hypothetical protein
MTADSMGNDLDAVSVPVTGIVAYAPLDAGNVIAKSALGANPLVMPSGMKKLGLVKQDGAPAETRDSGDAIEFWQKGYSIPGEGTRSVKVTLAEDNAAVMALTEGKTPDANGVIEVASGIPGNRFILFEEIRYRGGRARRREGVATITAIEPGQQTRGETPGVAVTFMWAEDPLFNNAPFWQWGPAIPGASAAKTGWSVAVTGSPTGGTFTLIVNGYATAPIAYNAAAADIATAINALSGVTGLSGVTVTGTTTKTVTFPSAATLTASSSLTGGTSPDVTVS